MHPSLRGYATAVAETSRAEGTLAELAQELLQVEGLLGTNHGLAATLTDIGVPVPARRAVLDELLAPRVLPVTLRIVVRIIETERAPEFLPALHDVAEMALHLAEDVADPSLEDRLSKAAGRQLVAGYAAALFETLPAVSDLEAVEDELFRFARVVESTAALRTALSNRSLPLGVRQGVARDLLESRVHPVTLRLVAQSLRGRSRDVVGTLDWLVEQAADARGWRVARVRTARGIEGPEQDQLSGAMQQLTGKPVELQIRIDPDLIGGAVVEVGNLIVDASLRHRLEQLQEHLLGPEGATRGATA